MFCGGEELKEVVLRIEFIGGYGAFVRSGVELEKVQDDLLEPTEKTRETCLRRYERVRHEINVYRKNRNETSGLL
jgi:hypothetical protein